MHMVLSNWHRWHRKGAQCFLHYHQVYSHIDFRVCSRSKPLLASEGVSIKFLSGFTMYIDVLFAGVGLVIISNHFKALFQIHAIGAVLCSRSCVGGSQ